MPVGHTGPVHKDDLPSLIGLSLFDSEFDHPTTDSTDDLMEGLYLRTERDGSVSGRAKFVP